VISVNVRISSMRGAPSAAIHYMLPCSTRPHAACSKWPGEELCITKVYNLRTDPTHPRWWVSKKLEVLMVLLRELHVPVTRRLDNKRTIRFSQYRLIRISKSSMPKASFTQRRIMPDSRPSAIRIRGHTLSSDVATISRCPQI
jgi:hypothetical protein